MDPHLQSQRDRNHQRCLEEPRKQNAFHGVSMQIWDRTMIEYYATKIHQSRCRFTLALPNLWNFEVSVCIDELQVITSPHPEECLVSWLVVVLGIKWTDLLPRCLSAASCNMRGWQRRRKSTQKRRIPPHVHCNSNHLQLGKLSSGWKMAKRYGRLLQEAFDSLTILFMAIQCCTTW